MGRTKMLNGGQRGFHPALDRLVATHSLEGIEPDQFFRTQFYFFHGLGQYLWFTRIQAVAEDDGEGFAIQEALGVLLVPLDQWVTYCETKWSDHSRSLASR